MQSSPPSEVDEAQALAASAGARTAAGIASMTGFLSVMTGVQMLISVRFFAAWASWAPWLMVLLGLGTMYVGTQVYRMRGWAAHAAIGLTAALALGMGVWNVFAIRAGIFSCVGLFVPLAALAGLVLSVRVRKECLRADAVREKLRDAGMDLGI